MKVNAKEVLKMVKLIDSRKQWTIRDWEKKDPAGLAKLKEMNG